MAVKDAQKILQELSLARGRDTHREDEEWTDVALWCSMNSLGSGTDSLSLLVDESLGHHGLHLGLQMQRIYCEIEAESQSVALPSKTLVNGLCLSGTSLALEVLAKFSVVGECLKFHGFGEANRRTESAAAYRISQFDPFSSSIMNLVASEFPKLNQNAYRQHLRSFFPILCKRYAGIVSEDNWVLLSILSHSRTFRAAAFISNRKGWNSLVQSINENQVSIEVFAKMRNLDYKSALVRISEHLPLHIQEAVARKQRIMPQIIPGLPHAYVVPFTMEEVYRPQYEAYMTEDVYPRPYDGKPHININSNIYKAANFALMPKPKHWPKHLDYPADPITRPQGSKCRSCSHMEICDCDPITCPLVTRPLVELKLYEVKGIGVRALQHIHKGDILAEYVGELWPTHSTRFHHDTIYSLCVQEDCGDQEHAVISARKYGNWTRYINHSCRPSTDWKYMAIGRRYRMMVVALRDIEMFEEITIHYGPDYFANVERDCNCGEHRCRLSEEYKLTGKTGMKFVSDDEWKETLMHRISNEQNGDEENEDEDDDPEGRSAKNGMGEAEDESQEILEHEVRAPLRSKVNGAGNSRVTNARVTKKGFKRRMSQHLVRAAKKARLF